MPDNVSDLERRVCSEILRIRTDRFPPDHFSLLGISPTIDDPSAIESAAKQQANRLRSETPKELISAARYVLKRIEKARICLSDASSRKAYLESLGKSRAKTTDDSAGTSSATQLGKARSTTPPARPTTTSPPSTTALESQPSRSDSFSALEPLTSSHNLDSLFGELSEEEVSSGVVGLIDRPYRSKKSNSGQAVVYGSVAAVSVAVLAVIGLVALLTGSESAETPAIAQSPVVAETSESLVDRPPHETASLPSRTNPKTAAAGSPGSGGASEPRSIESPSPTTESSKTGATLADSPSSALPPVEGASDVPDSPVPPPSAVTPVSIAPKDRAAEIPQADKPDIAVGSLEGLVSEIALPPLRTDQSAATAEDSAGVTDLGYLDEVAAKDLQIEVDEPRSKQFEYTRFYVERPDPVVAAWEIKLKAEPPKAVPEDPGNPKKVEAEKSQFDGAKEGFDETIASLILDDTGLKFRWGQTKHATLVEQLRNCVLVLSSGSHSRRLQLRPQRLTYKFVFDLSKSNHVFDVADEHLPHAEGICFEVSNIQIPSLSVDLDPADGIIKKSETLRLKTREDGIPVEFQFTLSVTTSKATVRFVPRHQLGRRWYPFTGEKVYGSIGDLQNALADGRGRLSAAQSAISSLPGQISSIESRIRADSPDYAQLASQRSLMVKQLNAARGTARRLSKSLPEIEAKIPQLASVAALGKQVHMKGRLEFRAYIPLEHGELVLLKTGTEDPPVEKEKGRE